MAKSLTGDKLASAGVVAKLSTDIMTSGSFRRDPATNLHTLIKLKFRLFMINYSGRDMSVNGTSVQGPPFSFMVLNIFTD